jgi:hypothetical protein
MCSPTLPLLIDGVFADGRHRSAKISHVGVVGGSHPLKAMDTLRLVRARKARQVQRMIQHGLQSICATGDGTHSGISAGNG